MIVAFVRLGGRGAVTLADLKAYCGRRLPPYMLPDRIVFLDAIAKGNRGKIDYLASGQDGGRIEAWRLRTEIREFVASAISARCLRGGNYRHHASYHQRHHRFHRHARPGRLSSKAATPLNSCPARSTCIPWIQWRRIEALIRAKAFRRKMDVSLA